MAKKVVATLKKGEGKNFAKVIRAVKSDKTGAYTFKEEIVPAELVKGKQKVTVRFQATGGNETAGVFGVRLVRADQ